MAEATDPLLWDLPAVRHQLGGVSDSTVRRLIARGELPVARVGGRVMVPSAAVREFVAQRTRDAENGGRMNQGALAPTTGESACQNKHKGSLRNRTANSGTRTTAMPAGDALNALLGL
ncbi:helix-turn-helix domain-containing protein [Thiorhodovibrio frisius]|uniref:helix-turn-helix domain-containing protein n=1 Tax=Thiorhodovibrio frisius TaxID=631362 RepID=UPI000A008F4B